MKFTKLTPFLAIAFVICGGGGEKRERQGVEEMPPDAIVIGVENFDYLPFYTVKDGEYQGFARELFDSFARSKGYRFVYRPLPVKRLFDNLLSKNIDFKFPDHPLWQKTLKKDSKVIYSQSVVRYTDGVLVRPEQKGKGQKHLKKLGTVLGFTPYDYLGVIKAKKVALSENPSFLGLIKQTLAKRIDGAYINIDVGLYQLESNLQKPKGLYFDAGLPHTKDSYYLSTTKHPKIIKQFNQYLKQNAGKLKKLKEKYNLDSL